VRANEAGKEAALKEQTRRGQLAIRVFEGGMRRIYMQRTRTQNGRDKRGSRQEERASLSEGGPFENRRKTKQKGGVEK
jgi:hypothetical protein